MLSKTLTLAVLLAATVASSTTGIAAASSNTIVDLAVATPELSTLVTALQAGDLVDTLSGRGPFTVFAPTNAAFALLPPEDLAFLLDPANVAELVNVLTYHVKADRFRAEDLTNREQLEMLQGQNVGVTIFGSRDRIFVNDGEVITADILATNGVVHIIDRVLIPPAGGGGDRPIINIVQLAGRTPELFVLTRLLGTAGLAPTLEGEGPFTVFAPTNDAFEKLPAEVLEFLTQPENIADLIAVLTYHVVSGETLAGSLCNSQRIETIEGRDVEVTILGDRVFINDSQVICTARLYSRKRVQHCYLPYD